MDRGLNIIRSETVTLNAVPAKIYAAFV